LGQGLHLRGNGYSAGKEIACFYWTRWFTVLQEIWGFTAVKI
jgi:hypothetical protein